MATLGGNDWSHRAPSPTPLPESSTATDYRIATNESMPPPTAAAAVTATCSCCTRSRRWKPDRGQRPAGGCCTGRAPWFRRRPEEKGDLPLAGGECVSDPVAGNRAACGGGGGARLMPPPYEGQVGGASEVEDEMQLMASNSMGSTVLRI